MCMRKRMGDTIKQTFTEWNKHKAPRMGAALAYYAVFSIPPLIVIVIAAVGLFYKGDVSGAITQQLGNLMGETTARTIMQTHQETASGGWIASLIGVGLLLFGAAGVFGELQDALNTVWEVEPKSASGALTMIKDR